MKNWVIIVLILIFVFIVIPVIVYGITVNAATKLATQNPQLAQEVVQRGIYNMQK